MLSPFAVSSSIEEEISGAIILSLADVIASILSHIHQNHQFCQNKIRLIMIIFEKSLNFSFKANEVEIC